MQINKLQKTQNFGRALSKQEESQFKSAIAKAKHACNNSGNSILIVHDVCLPENDIKTGCGYLSSKNSADFLDFMKTYTGINMVKVLPQGEIPKKHGHYCAYNASALSLGEHLINPELLATKEFGNLISEQDIKDLSFANSKNKIEGLVNYENITGINSPNEKLLRKAFVNFKISAPKNLKETFEKYKEENNDWLEPKAIYKIFSKKYNDDNFKHWSDADKNFYSDFNKEARIKRIKELKQNNQDEFEYYYFKEFLAEKNLKEARKKLNANGLKLMGDCLIGFSKDEQWAYPDAIENGYLGYEDWQLPALNYSNITDFNSPSARLLKRKVELFAKRYDAIRVDVGWAYINPILYPKNKNDVDFQNKYAYDYNINAYRTKCPLNENLINFIENTVKKVKGENFNKTDLIYEIEAGPKEFSAFNWSGYDAKIIPALKDKTIVQSTFYMNNNYGSVDFLKNNVSLSDDDFVIMTNNHDHLSLKKLALTKDDDNLIEENELKQIKENQIFPLSKHLKLDKASLQNPIEFAKAKFAEIFTAKHNKMFYMDVFGRGERFDAQEKKNFDSYRFQIPQNYKEEYFKTLAEGWGLNLADALAKVFKAKGLDKANPTEYENLIKFKKILEEK